MKASTASTAEELYAFLLDMAYKNIQRESPNLLQSVSTEPLKYDGVPSHIHPVFFGSFSWDGAVNSHWTLVRIARLRPSLPLVKEIIERLKVYFVLEKMEKELDAYQYVSKYYTPYGYSWLLALIAGIHKWDIGESKEFAEAFIFFETFTKKYLASFLGEEEKPERQGKRNNTAFSMILLYTSGKIIGDNEFTKVLEERAAKFYYEDTSFEDGSMAFCFLSPSLCVLHLMSLVMKKEEFIEWVNKRNWKPILSLNPVKGDKPSLDFNNLGLNFSRCWSLNHLARFFPAEESAFKKLAKEHYEASLPYLPCGDWKTDSWLPTFALMAELSFHEEDVFA
eukprot:TRINITY_DN6185_c0_g3_i1.p1 TRINITY_DN6185_c0_g3~~TRINITY_DN6185_c0_g3_i1.p1  ORF type:complete len:337 (-),score=62.04 TRINITY_DN6185_c0_g3_i1:137-1147(-)